VAGEAGRVKAPAAISPSVLSKLDTEREHHMTIGIIGSGAIGTAFARTLARVGIEAIISNSRGPDSLQELVGELSPSISAGPREEAARADIVFVAVNWTKLSAALAGLPDWKGRIVIDANNPIEAPLFKPVDLHGRVSSQIFADLVPGARVVKAFNHHRAEVLAGDPRADGGRRVLFYSGDDSSAKAEVAALIDRIGFVGIDLGSLAIGGKLAQFPGGSLPNQNLVKIG
jgi:predicted dinucleotide-binding enzyme